jgi:hypothetical protein
MRGASTCAPWSSFPRSSAFEFFALRNAIAFAFFRYVAESCRKPVRSTRCALTSLNLRAFQHFLITESFLIDAGFDPDRPLDAYRANVLAIRVRSIGAGAALTVEENKRGTKFATFRPWSDSQKPSAVASAIRLAA